MTTSESHECCVLCGHDVCEHISPPLPATEDCECCLTTSLEPEDITSPDDPRDELRDELRYVTAVMQEQVRRIAGYVGDAIDSNANVVDIALRADGDLKQLRADVLAAGARLGLSLDRYSDGTGVIGGVDYDDEFPTVVTVSVALPPHAREEAAERPSDGAGDRPGHNDTGDGL